MANKKPAKKSKTPNPVGHPPIVITDKMKKDIIMYRSLDFPMKAIAMKLGISVKSIYNHCKAELKHADDLSMMEAVENIRELQNSSNEKIKLEANKLVLERKGGWNKVIHNHNDITNSDGSLQMPNMIIVPMGGRTPTSITKQKEKVIVKDDDGNVIDAEILPN